MTTTLNLKTKEFKEILKVFSRFATHSQRQPSVAITYSPLQFVMVTDHVFVTAQPQEAIVEGSDEYCFNPEVLLGLTLKGEDVTLKWDNEGSLLHLHNGHLNTSLRVAVPQPDYRALPSDLESIDIPLGTLVGITKFLSIPFSFDMRKKELMPVRLRRSPDGFLMASADDGFSLAKITTNVPVASDFDIKIPKYIFDCLYSKGSITDDTVIPIGISGDKALFANGTIQVFTSGMNEECSDFDSVIYDFKPMTSFTFKPKTLSSAIKPLVDLVPKAERSATVLKVSVVDKVSMSVKHQDIGEGNIDEVEDIDHIYNEKAMRKSNIMMHPKCFQDYTSLFTVESGQLYANSHMVHYKGSIESGGHSMGVNYLFPTVQL